MNDRFKGLDWVYSAKNRHITMVGCGGIGSWTAMLISRAGMRTILIDPDTVDPTNIGGQFFFNDQVLARKVDAVAYNINDFGGIYFSKHPKRIEKCSDSVINPITIVGTDSIESRQTTYNKWKLKYKQEIQSPNSRVTPLFVDGRLLAESFQILCIRTTEDMERYELEFLFPDSEVPDVSCTAKQTSHYAAMIAANITRFITNHISNCENGLPKYVPFLYEINGILPDTVAIADTQPEVQTVAVEKILKEKKVEESVEDIVLESRKSISKGEPKLRTNMAHNGSMTLNDSNLLTSSAVHAYINANPVTEESVSVSSVSNETETESEGYF